MTLATLKMKGLAWDDVKIAFGGEQPAIVALKDRTAVEDLHCTLMNALFDNEDAPLTLTIDGNAYTLEAPVWVELLDKVAAWMEEYLPATNPDYLKSEIDLKLWNKNVGPLSEINPELAGERLVTAFIPD
jgi:hypothetical protein